ncbi:MAG: PspA/IM30 family protein [Fidelibacterota bacterium]
MAGIFQRIFKIGQSEAHAVIDRIEDPIRLTEQGIRDLKKDLESSMRSLAEVKAVVIRLKKQAEEQQKLGADYERKAMLLLQRMEEGAISKKEAERLATEALNKKKECDERSLSLTKEYQRQQQMADKLQSNITKLKSTISTYENELITLKARAKTATSTRKINQQLSKIDSSSTIVMLEKMKDKVQEEEALAEAYSDIALEERSVDEEIDRVLEDKTKKDVKDSLSELKAKMGIKK